MKTIHTGLKDQQSGLASILITMIMMIVITLIVLGFAQIARHEQRETLDAQLSSQAFYAAESGINDALAIYNANPGASKSTCSNGNAPWNTLSTQLSAQTNVSVTCLTFNPTPSNLIYTSVNTSQAQVANVQASSGALNQIIVSWQDSAPPTMPNYTKCLSAGPPAQFPPLSGWPSGCTAGVLRLDLVPANTLNSDVVLFLYPTAVSANPPLNSTPTTVSSGLSGSVVPAACNHSSPAAGSSSILYPYDCNVVLNVSGLPTSSVGYYVRFLPIYADASVALSAVNATNPTQNPISDANALPLTNGQLAADATGKAQDVLRRVEERIPAAQLVFPAAPNDALQSTNSICKEFTYTTSGGASGYGATTSC
jgi:Tfp pilus assembly protein PilX